ncbi:DUF3088 family protein [Pseudoalteromonas ardens]|uniref:GST N-terminal domain-containing protein n=1 Tax=Pseudoalteromonas rubra TaxID=43658 RepID=A0A0L0EVB2_9GAMM|nr:DUF3088 family protein [Pseudoalteromonas sp. R96]KNC68407.1 hypothetical protein AC626_04990 [Pseudoalteromonas rubra]MDK1313407.1 DUF3088 family protein [Pseudoalteromonas sp. R96]
MKPKLFVLKMPFEDGPGKMWICSHCALIEGALSVNPHWQEAVDVRRIDFPKPRSEVVALLGEDKQWLPVLVINKHNTITDPVEIINYLAAKFGGASVHP